MDIRTNAEERAWLVTLAVAMFSSWLSTQETIRVGRRADATLIADKMRAFLRELHMPDVSLRDGDMSWFKTMFAQPPREPARPCAICGATDQPTRWLENPFRPTAQNVQTCAQCVGDMFMAIEDVQRVG